MSIWFFLFLMMVGVIAPVIPYVRWLEKEYEKYAQRVHELEMEKIQHDCQ